MRHVKRNNLGIAEDTINNFENIIFQDEIDDRYFSHIIKNLGYFTGNGELTEGDNSKYLNREKDEICNIQEIDRILSKDKDAILIRTKNLLKMFGDE